MHASGRGICRSLGERDKSCLGNYETRCVQPNTSTFDTHAAIHEVYISVGREALVRAAEVFPEVLLGLRTFRGRAYSNICRRDDLQKEINSEENWAGVVRAGFPTRNKISSGEEKYFAPFFGLPISKDRGKVWYRITFSFH